MPTVGIACDHLVKLYQFLDDFAQAIGGCQRRDLPDLAQSHEIQPYAPNFALRYGKICDNFHLMTSITLEENTPMAIDDKTRTELEAAAFRRLVEHLRSRTDVQNIDLMNLAGFCRNCLSNWLKEEADAKGAAMTRDESREAVYGMPYETWKATHQGPATSEQIAAMKKSHGH
jgi:hypothetical protein